MDSKAVEKLLRGTQQVVPREDLQKKLAKEIPLVIKFGADPTAPDLHLGHAVVLLKLREFQDQGHQVVFLIGDFTARIGDPSGKSKTRPPLSPEQIAENAKTYFSQVARILDPSKITIAYNSQWLESVNLHQFIQLAGRVTLARIIEREDFAKRIEEKTSIGFHELFYPVLQGYDSVVLKADVELGGTDQTFNLLMGRFLQEQFGQEPQVIMTLPLLRGLDGVQKMSKSLGNAIGLSESAQEAYGKLMSISDELMWEYLRLLVALAEDELKKLQDEVAAGLKHPMDIKKFMAFQIVARFWSSTQADEAQKVFEELFQKKDWAHAKELFLKDFPSSFSLIDFLKKLEIVDSSSEAKRLIEAGAVKINDEKIIDPKYQLSLQVNMHIRVGKHRFYKVV